MLTGVIIALKGEKRLKQFIAALDFCDEVLVMENKGEANIDFSDLRNKALKDAKNEWVLYVDTDEIISGDLREEILSTVKNPSYKVYRIKREDIFWGKPVLYGEVLKARNQGLIRLMRKDSGRWKGKVHEEFISAHSAGQLEHVLIHSAHDSIAGFLGKINFYSTLRAEELHTTGRKTNVLEIIFVPVVKFLYSFFVLGGFRDSERGFVYSFMMSFHSFLVRSKLYLLQS